MGLVLVFLGVLVTTYQTLLGQVKRETLAPLKRAAWVTLGVFGFGLIGVATGTAWLLSDGGTGFYHVTAALFFAELLGLVVASVYATLVLLR
ncbi:MAG TPA: hypothetical protein VFM96_12815 [Gaiellaceae bacterium]|nr:hypothetical protein [Gaiellaceae bacterium]